MFFGKYSYYNRRLLKKTATTETAVLSDFIILIYIHIYINITVNVTVRPHPRSGDSQGQETFLALSADKQTRNYYIE